MEYTPDALLIDRFYETFDKELRDLLSDPSSSLLDTIRLKHLRANFWRKCETDFPNLSNEAGYEDQSMRERNARENFATAQKACEQVNTKFYAFSNGYEENFRKKTIVTLNNMRYKLFKDNFGSFDDFLDVCLSNFKYAKGKSAFQEHWSNLLPFKYGVEPLRGTAGSFKLFDTWCKHLGLIEIFANQPRFVTPVSIGRQSFVPKNYRTLRTVITTANIDMFAQLMIGEYITWYIKRVYRIDLSTQPEFNGLLAAIGSADGELATVDIKMSSDTQAGALFEYLFVDDFPWFWEALNASRVVTVITPDGVEEVLQMFHTMGNGFTFPLQTLLYLLITESLVVDHNIKPKSNVPVYNTELFEKSRVTNFAVYGDDIICPSEIVEDLRLTLADVGIEFNLGKTNVGAVPFRESCGADYWCGHDIRYIQCKTLENVGDMHHIINELITWSWKFGPKSEFVYQSHIHHTDVIKGIFPGRAPWFVGCINLLLGELQAKGVLCVSPLFQENTRAGVCMPLRLAHHFGSKFNDWTIAESSQMIHVRLGKSSPKQNVSFNQKLAIGGFLKSQDETLS